jgi:hypothetical protein
MKSWAGKALETVNCCAFLKRSVMNQVGNSNFPPSVHPIFFSTNIRNENNTREIQKWPRARDRTSLIFLRCVFFLYKLNITRSVPTGFVNHTEECK